MMADLEPALLRDQVSLADYTTWRVGGPAEWLAEPTQLDQLNELMAWAQQQQMPWRVIGAGSNLLISDAGLPGLTICLRKLQGMTLDRDSGIVDALAGEPIPTLARHAAKAGLHGLEWAVGIPGTVGGAAVMNAGAQGGCTAERLISVEVIVPSGNDGTSATVRTFTNAELDFSYRHSRLQESNLMVISAVCMSAIPEGEPDEQILDAKAAEICALTCVPIMLTPCVRVETVPLTMSPYVDPRAAAPTCHDPIQGKCGRSHRSRSS